MLLYFFASASEVLFILKIYLIGEPLGRYVSRWTKERRLVLMVTYENLFDFVIMLCAVITLVIYCIHKNSAPALVK